MRRLGLVLVCSRNMKSSSDGYPRINVGRELFPYPMRKASYLQVPAVSEV